MANNKINARMLVMCGLFSALTAVGAFLKVPVPVVPFTLQFLFTMLAGLLLGGKFGCISVCVYMAVGLIGVPVFAEGGGIGYLLKPSFGYIIGFAIGAYLTGKIANKTPKPSYKRLLAANFTGLLVVYAIGMIYYYIVCNLIINQPIALYPLFLYCFVLAVPGDIVLCLLAAVLGKRLIPIARKERIYV